jgi:soluble lytic murein transglycosylase
MSGTLFMVQRMVLSLAILLSASLAAAAPAEKAKAGIQDARLIHARELLGKSFAKKVTRKSRDGVELSDFVIETTRKFLPKKFQNQSGRIAEAILDSAEEYKLDPVFLMAIIQNESSFNPKRVGTSGEIGLMQILPRTAEWISELYSLDYQNSKSLYDPVKNVWLGAALIDRLRHQFDSEGNLYVSAYNIGPKKVRNLVSKNKTPKIYVNAVMKRYVAIYEGFKAKGDLKTLSQVAWVKVRDVTQP